MSARNLAAGVAAHLRGDRQAAEGFFMAADDPAVRAWTESIWGKKSPYTCYRPVAGSPPVLPADARLLPRNAPPSLIVQVHERDGYYCRFCNIPVIRGRIRTLAAKAYTQVQWEGGNASQHAGFQCMWAQYDHIVPNARGGTTTLDNVYLTCAACNYGRMHYTLEEVGLIHPAAREPRKGDWTGLEDLLVCKPGNQT